MTTNTTKQTIEIDIPEGWQFVRFGLPVTGDYYLEKAGQPRYADRNFQNYLQIIVLKKKPIRRVFELVSEIKRKACAGDICSHKNNGMNMIRWGNSEKDSEDEYYIFKEIKGEGDEEI